MAIKLSEIIILPAITPGSSLHPALASQHDTDLSLTQLKRSELVDLICDFNSGQFFYRTIIQRFCLNVEVNFHSNSYKFQVPTERMTCVYCSSSLKAATCQHLPAGLAGLWGCLGTSMKKLARKTSVCHAAYETLT